MKALLGALLLSFGSLQAAVLFVADEVTVIEDLIGATEKQLNSQKELKQLIVSFREQQENFMKGTPTKKQAIQMVNTAKTILSLIDNMHLRHLFTDAFLEELAWFTSLTNKKAPTPP